MKARWLIAGSLACFLLGWVIPFALYANEVNQGADDLGDVLWVLVAPSLYAYITLIFWILAAVMFIAGIFVWLKGRKKGKKIRR